MSADAYRRRLALEWRAATTVTIAAAVVALLGQLPLPIARPGLFVGLLAVIVVAGTVVVVDIFRRPLLSTATSSRFPRRDVLGAAARVRRGERVDPPELRAAAIDSARRGLRPTHLSMAWLPLMGGGWVLNHNSGSGVDTVLRFVGACFLVLGLAFVTYSGRVQHHLDTLEQESRPVTPGSVDGSAPAPGRP